MKKLYFLLFTFLITSISFAQTSDLYFSMYGEGGGSNKWLEIYNGTGSDVDLSDYSVELYANGSATATGTEALTGMLNDGDVYVIYNASAVAGITANGDLASTITFFNGDDAVALLKTGSVIDVIGEIGNDPGSGWQVGDTAGGTANHTLVRKFAVCDPNSTNLDSFGTDDATSEWIVYGQDAEFGQIGTHAACSSSPILTITAPGDLNEFSPETTNVTVALTVLNFTVANGSGDGHIHWTVQLNSDSPVDQGEKYDTSNESIAVTAGQSYTLYMELVDNSEATIGVNQTVTFSVLPPCANNIGDIIVTEIMQNPAAVSDGDGEWFEIYNTTGSDIDINGWTISDNGSNSHQIASSLIVPMNGYAVLGNNGDIGTNGNVSVDYEYSNFTLGNGSDQIILTCSGTVIDDVDYDDGTTFPADSPGGSMELSTTKLTGTDNDLGANWSINTTSQYGLGGNTGDFGTPGAMNDFALSTNDFNKKSFSVYPNPTNTGSVNVVSSQSSNGKLNVAVYDVLGKQVISTKMNSEKLDVSSLNTGVYIMKITQGKAISTKKLVIN